MTQASQNITQQWKDGGVVGADLQGQSTVSKKYVDDQLAIRDGNIAAASGAAGAAQESIDNHIVDPKAHPAQNITYSGAIIGTSNVKQALDKTKQTIDDLILGSGDSGPEVSAARGGYPLLGDRLDASDADLAKTVKVDELVFNVKNHGATGDGFTDDTAAIKSAIDIINNRGGGTLYFPKGRYLISSTLVLSKSAIIRGDGSHITAIVCNSGFTTQYDSVIVFRYDTNHCDAVSMYDIRVMIGAQPAHGITGYSVYDSVVFQNVIVEGTDKTHSCFRFIPHPDLLDIDPVSQTLLLNNCIGYVGADDATAPVFYFESVQEMNMIGCKAFAQSLDFKTLSAGFVFDCCRGVTMVGCSIGGGGAVGAEEIYPIQITASYRTSRGFLITGLTVESAPKVLYVKGKPNDPVTEVNLIANRNEGSGGANPTIYLEHVRDSNIEVLTGTTTQINVTNSIVRNPQNLQFLNDELHQESAGVEVLISKYPYAIGTGLFLLVNNGTVADLRQVNIGAPDSAGSGYRTLRVLN